MSTKGKRKTLW